MINLKAFINSMKLPLLRRVLNSDCSRQFIIQNTVNLNDKVSFGKRYTDHLLKDIKNQF